MEVGPGRGIEGAPFTFHGGRVEIRVEGACPPVMADPDHLRQVLVNLLLNAGEAMQRGAVEARRIEVRLGGSGERGRVEVADTGPGVDPRIADGLFEPFATTRPAGEGTGLGLAISRRLVEAMGGALSLRPADTGAVFAIELPLAPSDSA